MPRLIDPPKSDLSRLPTPLTAGQQAVLDLFDRRLQDGWEFYVQPHLNGLRPDLVLLNPKVGIAVFEINDWDLTTCSVDQPLAAPPRLMMRDSAGRCLYPPNPLDRIQSCKSELFNLYCPRLNAPSGVAAITAGLIFTRAPRARVEQVFSAFLSHGKATNKYRHLHPLSGSDDLEAGDLDTIFPEWARQKSTVMSAKSAADLRGWLKDPYCSQEQPAPLDMDDDQRRLATTRTGTGYRRIKGPAGAGKSLVLAARAAVLADEGKHVLVVTFNITLLNYLRDLAVRHVTGQPVIRRQIDFLNFQQWCKRVCNDAGCKDEYDQLWGKTSTGSEAQRRDPILENELPKLVQSLYTTSSNAPRYDAILVDEGQDYRPIWWHTLCKAVKPGGEMLFVADKTQNIYGTAAAWTETAMAHAGFSDPWSELRGSYRLPQGVIPILRNFSDAFLARGENDIPEHTQAEVMNDPVELRWVQVCTPGKELEVCVDEVHRFMEWPIDDTVQASIVFLAEMKMGAMVIENVERRKGMRVLDTFSRESCNRKKRALFQGQATVKATTPYNFQGWEGRHLVLYVENAGNPALLYTALTRLRRHANGSALSVVSSCPAFSAFGRAWPDFVEV